LEHELLDRVAAVKSTNPLAAVLIIVPSRRLADHVTHRLVERFGALLNVSVVHHRALDERVAESVGIRWRPVLDEALADTLFARVIQRAPAGRLRDFVRVRPGASFALRRTLTHLREACLSKGDAAAVLTRTDPEVAELYARWTDALEELARDGRAIDDAGLAREAAEKAEGFAARFATILHHGAYDVIGVRVELLRALDRGREVTFLLPADPKDSRGAFGVERARGIAGPEVPLEALDREAPSAAVDCFHAQGASAELQTAVYEALGAVASGVPPREVAIVLRSFAPYTAALDALFDSGEPFWHTSYTRPLRRDPKARAALRAMAEAADRGPRGFRDHADELAALARRASADERLTSLLGSMRGVETVLGDARKVSLAEARAWLDARVDAATVPPDGADGGGIRILDAMQSRGLTFTRLGLAGMNGGVFPRIAPEDPFLCDASLRRLRESTGRPLPIAAESDGEERLLLAMLLRQSRASIQVSWQRADETARPLVRSLALREIPPKALDEARALPAHPRSRYAAWASSPGVLSPRDETLLAGLASELGAEAAPVVVVRRPELAHGIALVAATETFAPGNGRYDGRIGISALPATINATSLERLGRCPLQFFFRDVLRVEAPRRPPTPFSDDPRTVGDRVHEALKQVYARLRDERAFEGGDVDARIGRAQQILREAWTATLASAPPAREASVPLLDGIESGIWMRTLDAFLDADLRRLAETGLVPTSFEHKVETTIAGGPPGLPLRARFDRVAVSSESTVIGDYKTGRDLASRLQATAMVSGLELQVPIYALIAGAPVELLGVGPRSDGEIARFDDFKSSAVREGVLETLRVAAALAAGGTYPIHSGAHCEICDYRSACRRTHPPTEFREEAAPDASDARDCWKKNDKMPSLAAVRQAAS
jgi:RecB family exonuclease